MPQVVLARWSAYPAPVRLGLLVLGLAMFWLPIAPFILLLPLDENTQGLLLLALVGIIFLGIMHHWGQRVHGYRSSWSRYGLVWTWRNGQELGWGVLWGWLLVWALFGAIALWGWGEWQPFDLSVGRWMVEGSLTAAATAFGEELCFRGWLLDELERDYAPPVALALDSAIFAILHFIKPWSEVIRTFPQFPGLILLGLTLVWARRRTGYRLGQALGLHAGLVWAYYVINVGNLMVMRDRVPAWLTGVDRNPLAGLMGLGFLSLLAFGVWRQSRSLNRE